MLRTLLLAFLVAKPTLALRVISTSPQVTELLFQLGKGKDVIATTQFSDHPEEAKALPRIGPFFMPGIEATLRLAPDWMILDGSLPNVIFLHALESLNIPHLSLKLASIEDLFDGSKVLLRTLYHEVTNARLEQYRSCVDSLKKTHPPFRFLAFVSLSPPVLFGFQTLLSDLITRMGGTNALPTRLMYPYPQVSEEWLFNQSVDVAFFLQSYSEETELAQTLRARWWPQNKTPMITLALDPFARSSFAVFHHLNKLFLPRAIPLPKECLEF